jgi:hypothetical protein
MPGYSVNGVFQTEVVDGLLAKDNRWLIAKDSGGLVDYRGQVHLLPPPV